MVVAGVLVAFGLNGYYNQLQDQNKERAYLSRISQDFESSIKMQEVAIEHQRESVKAGSMVLRAAYSDSLPDSKTLVNNLFRFMQFSAGNQVSSTLKSLISTGDLQLIKDDSVRVVLSKMSSTIETHASNMEHISYQWLIPAFERFTDEINISDMRIKFLGREQLNVFAQDSLQGVPPADNLITIPDIDLKELLRSPSFRAEATKFFVAQQNLYQQEVAFPSELKFARDLLPSRASGNVPLREPQATCLCEDNGKKKVRRFHISLSSFVKLLLLTFHNKTCRKIHTF